MKISVIVASISTTTLETTVTSICQQSWQNWELWIVGQGSDPDLPPLGQQLSAKDARINYIHLEQCGATRARNAGTKAATGEILAFIDDDCRAYPDWLATIAACFQTNPAIGVVGGALHKPAKKSKQIFASCPHVEPEEVIYDPIAAHRHAPDGWDWIGANLGIRREVFEQAGGFDEYLGPGTEFPAGEDTALKLALEALGIKMLTTPRSEVEHTYGYRYGLTTLVKHQRNYAWGNGGLAAKLTLMGDKRGLEWRKMILYEATLGAIKSLKLYRIPITLRRYWLFNQAYRYCLTHYVLNSANQLRPR